MRKKNLYVLAVVLILTAGGFAVALGAALQHEPHFYRACAVPASAERKKLSDMFVKDAFQMLMDIKNRDGGHWHHAFTEAQINSFFEEDFVRLGEAENLRNHGVTAPRVLLEDNKIRLAFRYGTGWWSTVVSYDLRIWLVPREPNTIAVQFLNRRLGAVPVSSQTLLNEVVEVARRQGINIETTVYRHEGCPVAVLRLQADGPRPTTSLHCLKVNPACLCIAGGSSDLDTSVCPLKQ